MATFCSFFQQALAVFPRSEFDHHIQQWQTERHARGFSSWDHFVSMLYCQVGNAKSLREICDALESIEGKATHLGIEPPKRSTLAYANAHRPFELFESTFASLLARVTLDLGPRHKFRFRNPLRSIDTSVIDLCASLFDWARYKRRKGAVKLHMVLDHAGYLPNYCHITDGKTSDIAFARTLDVPAGTVLVFDRGYVDYTWFNRLTARKVWFVTRLRKSDSVHSVVPRPGTLGKNVLADDLVTAGTGEKAPTVQLRRITVATEKGPFEVFTNNLTLAASTIAEIYRDRWQIEVFFKAIKQNLRIKTFVGTSANALKIQIWSALIAILLLKFLQMKARSGWSLSRLVALFRLHLFTYRDLWSWLDQPLSTLDDISPQLPLQFG